MDHSTAAERGARVSFPPPLVFVVAILSGAAVACAGAPAHAPVQRAISLVGGIVVLATGVSLIASARLLFLRTRQNPAPWKPTPELILNGPYRFTRNPMYLGCTLVVLGLGLTSNNLWISLFAAPALLAVHFIAVLPEERYLCEKFGEPYERYLVQVRRYV
jgi:protein-S-isoprenylcysteine O-methyltransferase Ste14